MPLVTIARVAVAAATYMFDKPYDYVIPKALEGKVVPGVRVTAPFGRGNRCSEALVLSTYEGERSADLKVIDAVLDDAPVLDQGEMRLAFWLRERYFCTIYDAVKTILPAGLWYRVRETYHIVGGIPTD